jgi:PhoPQ-activated pathogenicity-related protein
MQRQGREERLEELNKAGIDVEWWPLDKKLIPECNLAGKVDPMKKRGFYALALLPILAIASAVCIASASSDVVAAERPTALDAYVHAPDSHYQYKLVQKAAHAEYTAYLIRMTSQEWRTAAEVNQSVWKHWMLIYIPRTVTHSIGMLSIRGGSVSDKKPEADEKLGGFAAETQSVITELFDIPNEPLIFANDSFGPRSEDQIIAYTWRKYLDNGDATWPLRLPMTKAVVRAMDTVTAFAASKKGGRHQVDRFFVVGASKRGWTTWSTAAVDPRVAAIAPMVIDVLNVIPSFVHHYRSYGFWAPAVKSYYDEHLMDELDSKAFKQLMDIEDPYSYRDRLTMPKLMINAAGDQFFLPDSSQFYFDDLPGEKHLLYEANADHSLKGANADESIAAFYQSVLNGGKRPDFRWSFAADGAIRVTAEPAPLKVTLWQATNPEHRDFRVEAIGRAYQGSSLTAESPGIYVARVPQPEKGWTAFFVEATFAGEGKYPFKFTTAVRVLPDVESYPLPEKGKMTLQLKSETGHY